MTLKVPSNVTVIGHLAEDQYYCYINYHSVTNLPIYVGKGKRHRYLPRDHRDSYRWKCYLKKYGNKTTPSDIFPCDSEDEAYQFEKELIFMFKCDGIGIFNKTDGGDAPPAGWGRHRSHSLETRLKMSAAKKGKKRGPHSDLHKANLSKSNTGQVSWCKGKKRGPQTPEHRRKLSVLRTGRKWLPEAVEKGRATRKRNRELKLALQSSQN